MAMRIKCCSTILVFFLSTSAGALSFDVALSANAIHPGAPLTCTLKLSRDEAERNTLKAVYLMEEDLILEMINDQGLVVPKDAPNYGRSIRSEGNLWGFYFRSQIEFEKVFVVNKWRSTRLCPGTYRVRLTLKKCSTATDGETRSRLLPVQPVFVRELPLTILPADDAKVAESYAEAMETARTNLAEHPDSADNLQRARSAIDQIAYAWDPVVTPFHIALLEGKSLGGFEGLVDEHLASISQHLVGLSDVEVAKKVVACYRSSDKKSSVNHYEDVVDRFVVWMAAEFSKSQNREIREVVRDLASRYEKRNDPFYLMSLPD